MRLLFLIAILQSLSASAVTKTPPSTAIMGPGTLSAPLYPESGDQSRIEEDDASLARSTTTFEGTNQDEKKDTKEITTGPYDRNGVYNYLQGLVR